MAMTFHLAIWSLLIVIGVSDVMRHRIPNKMILLLIAAVLVELFFGTNNGWHAHLVGFVYTTCLCFVFYFMKAMAGGDVKLLAAIGLWLGSEQMWLATPYIVIAGGVIATLYLARHLASSPITMTEQMRSYAVQKVTPGWKSSQPLVIPFAPAVVIGLAYFFYIH